MDCHNIHMLFHSGVYCWFILLLTQALISCIRVLLSGVLWCITCSFFHCSCSHSSYLTLNTICLSYINMFIYQQDVAHREPTNIGCHDWGVTQSLSLQECYIRQIFEHKHREIYRKIMEFVSLNMMSWNWHFDFEVERNANTQNQAFQSGLLRLFCGYWLCDWRLVCCCGEVSNPHSRQTFLPQNVIIYKWKPVLLNIPQT